MTLFEKILELKKLVKVMKQDAKGQNSKYVSEDAILEAITQKMEDLKVMVTPSVKNGTLNSYVNSYKTKDGKDSFDIVVSADMVYVWSHADDNDTLEVEWGLIGQQRDAAQAYGSGLTYANRYFLSKYFQISTSEQDPDRLELQRMREKRQNYEAYQGMFVDYDLATKIIKTAIKELYQRLGVRLEDLKVAYKHRNWHKLEDANIDSLFGLERHLRTLNTPEHEWHNLYNNNERAKNVVPIRQEVNYTSSQELFGKWALSQTKDRSVQLDIVEFYESGGIDLRKYMDEI